MNTSEFKADRGKRERIRLDRLSRYATSGLDVATFCEYESVFRSNFYRWRVFLAGQTETGTTGAPAPGFIELGTMRAKHTNVVDSAPAAMPDPASLEIVLDLGHGLVLRIVRRCCSTLRGTFACLSMVSR